MGCPVCDAIRGLLYAQSLEQQVVPQVFAPPYPGQTMPYQGEPVQPKKKGKVSAYNREYKRQFARLRKLHPKTAFKTLVKRAHKATKKARAKK